MYKQPTDIFPQTLREKQAFVTKEGFEVSSALILPYDAKPLVDFFYKLSPLTIRMRFKDILNPPPMKEVWQLAKLMAGADNQKQLVIVASVEKSVGRRIVGIARYSALEADPKAADAAIIVRDDFQKQGLGSFLLKQLLTEAQAKGFEKIMCSVPADNPDFLRFIESRGFEMMVNTNSDHFEYGILLPADKAAA